MKLWSFVVVPFAISLGAIFWMAYVLFNEGWLGRGVNFIEPNILLARIEFDVLVLGFFWMVGVYFWIVTRVR